MGFNFFYEFSICEFLKVKKLRSICFYFVFSFFVLSAYSLANNTEAAKKLDEVKKIKNKTHQEAKKSQKKINQLDDETETMIDKYRYTLKKTDNLRVYNEQLASYIEAQKKEVLDIRRKIEEVKDTGQDIVPLMLRMLDSLEQFIDLDIPFLIDERKKRVTDLKNILQRSDVSVSEKYRQLISAFKLELEYGKTLQSYRGLRKIEGKELTVDYVRLGRLIFLYISLDGKHISYWDHRAKIWKKLPRSYRKSVIQAVKTAKKQVPPDLIKLPLVL